MLPKRGRARTGCAACRRHKTFLRVCVQKGLAIIPHPTYNLTYSMTPSDPHSRIAVLERELAWAHLKIQSLTEELRQQRVKLLGPRSETLAICNSNCWPMKSRARHWMRCRRKHG